MKDIKDIIESLLDMDDEQMEVADNAVIKSALKRNLKKLSKNKPFTDCVGNKLEPGDFVFAPYVAGYTLPGVILKLDETGTKCIISFDGDMDLSRYKHSGSFSYSHSTFNTYKIPSEPLLLKLLN